MEPRAETRRRRDQTPSALHAERTHERGRGKVEFEDLCPGTGEVATREHTARVSLTVCLHRGEVVQQIDDTWIDLRRRETVAGVRYGIEGMRIRGRRRLVIPPQLGYGTDGAPGARIPAKAMLICDVTLHELRPSLPIKPKLKLARERKASGQKPDSLSPSP